MNEFIHSGEICLIESMKSVENWTYHTPSYTADQALINVTGGDMLRAVSVRTRLKSFIKNYYTAIVPD